MSDDAKMVKTLEGEDVPPNVVEAASKVAGAIAALGLENQFFIGFAILPWGSNMMACGEVPVSEPDPSGCPSPRLTELFRLAYESLSSHEKPMARMELVEEGTTPTKH